MSENNNSSIIGFILTACFIAIFYTNSMEYRPEEHENNSQMYIICSKLVLYSGRFSFIKAIFDIVFFKLYLNFLFKP